MSTTRTSRRGPIIALTLVVIAGVALGARYWLVRRERAAQPPVFHGNVDIRDVTLAFRVAGRVEEVLKREGDRVSRSETIARLDPAPYRAALSQARAAVEVARSQLQRIEAGSRREDISEQRALLAERKATLRRAEDTLQRYTRLVGTGAVTEQALIDARAAAEQSRAAVNAASASLARAVDGSRVEDIEVARAQLAQAEAAAATAELNLTDTELKAADGGVVVTRAIEPGAIVAAGSPALVVAFDDPVWIRAFAPEKQLAQLAPGTSVDVSTDARPGRPYRGQVGYVAAQAEFTPKNVETAELRSSLVYRFRVVVSAHDGGLRQGMPVTVHLTQKPTTPTASHEPAPPTHAAREEP